MSGRLPRAISADWPRANRTGEGSKEPELHARPLDAAMPAMSRPSKMGSPSTPVKEKLALLGSLWVAWPFRRLPGIRSNTDSMIWSLRAEQCWLVASLAELAASRASDRPKMPEMF